MKIVKPQCSDTFLNWSTQVVEAERFEVQGQTWKLKKFERDFTRALSKTS